ncbi:uncharacterized protein [Periplaneta americana]|uniref:uncharacterized protein isoform X4 n=1 Tax=Periplaneta americana TaxID=6978 RepID=UPI0037E9C388
MDVIKIEPDADTLGLQPHVDTYEIGENNTLSEEVTGMKTECVDHSCDLTSQIKVEDTAVAISFPVVKSEVDEDLFDVDRVQQEVEVSSKEDEVLTNREKSQHERHAHFSESEKSFDCYSN